jgi:hypothetical protein
MKIPLLPPFVSENPCGFSPRRLNTIYHLLDEQTCLANIKFLVNTAGGDSLGEMKLSNYMESCMNHRHGCTSKVLERVNKK